MTKTYELGVLFMGKMLLVEYDLGVYGENEHRVQEELGELKKRLKEFLKERDYVRLGADDLEAEEAWPIGHTDNGCSLLICAICRGG